MHLNIQGGVLKKRNDLELILNDSNILVVCLNEHWLSKNSINLLNSFQNYKLASFYCRENGSYGGSCILLQDYLNFTVRDDVCKLGEDSVFEISCLEIRDLDIVVVSLYRVPKSENFEHFLGKLDLLMKLLTRKIKVKNIYIAADFNVDILESCKSFQQKLEFLAIVETYGFKFNFLTPTRITANGESCIDNILSLKIKNNLVQHNIDLELGISDHRALYISLPNEKCTENKKTLPNKKTRIFSKNNIFNFTNNLNRVQWEVSYCNSFDKNCFNFFSCFQNMFEESFPLKFFNTKSKSSTCKKTWVTEGIKVSSKRKRELSKRVKQSNDLNFKSYVKKYKLVFKAVCNKSKELSNSRYIKEADNITKAAWSVVKSEVGVKNRPDNDFPDLMVNGQPLEDGNLIASYFNIKSIETSKQFGLCFNNDLANKLSNEKQKIQSSQFQFESILPNDVTKIIKSIKTKKSAGCDEIPVDLMKRISHLIAEPICIIVNQSFQNNIFPYHLKYAELKPIYKKGEKQNPDNYRPISILPSFSKIFEKVAFQQLSNFLEKSNQLAKEQFGFRRGRNTIGAVANFIEEVYWALDGSQNTLGVFCDLSKAFDCVNHKILLQKLYTFNLSKNTVSWIESYLYNRKQRTIISKGNITFKSSWKRVQDGVPQGSILGPLLFLLYVNDLPLNISNSLTLYADDTTAVIKANSNAELYTKLEGALTELSEWFEGNFLKMNHEKTQLIRFCTSWSKDNLEDSDKIKIQKQSLSLSKYVKFLGVDLDMNLTWNKSIQVLSGRLTSACFQMLILRDTVDLKTRTMVYYGYFFSILQYGIEFWGASSQSSIIFKLQKRFLRTMTFSSRRQSCKSIFKELKILTLPSLFILKTLMFVHSNFNEISNTQFDHVYNTRNKDDFQFPKHRLKLTEKSPMYMGKKLFNNLPNDIKLEITHNTFKRRLTNFLLEKNYYSLIEFLSDNTQA